MLFFYYRTVAINIIFYVFINSNMLNKTLSACGYAQSGHYFYPSRPVHSKICLTGGHAHNKLSTFAQANAFEFQYRENAPGRRVSLFNRLKYDVGTLHRNQMSLSLMLADKLLTLQPVKKTDTLSFQILAAIFFKNNNCALYQQVKYIS